MSRVIAIDVGAGTADIVIRSEDEPPENSVKLVVPSQTQVVAARIREATRRGAAVLFHGPTMGGGANARAMKAHTAAGLPFLATETAARSFSDDLEPVRALGVQIVDDDEAMAVATRGRLSAAGAGSTGGREVVAVASGDVAAATLLKALRALGIDPAFTSVAVAVQDHGFDPAGSNRVLRFSLWERAVRDRTSLPELFYWAQPPATGGRHDAAGSRPQDDASRPRDGASEPQSQDGASEPRSHDRPRIGIPAVLTRMRAAASCAAGLGDGSLPLLAGDTGPAALLGALADEAIAGRAAAGSEEPVVLVNIGNGHTIAVVSCAGRLTGVYEHHTRMLDQTRLVAHLRRFLAGDLDSAEVLSDGGHGVILAQPVESPAAFLVSGPRRGLLQGSPLPVRHPAPWGDMMIAGAVGLVRAQQY